MGQAPGLLLDSAAHSPRLWGRFVVEFSWWSGTGLTVAEPVLDESSAWVVGSEFRLFLALGSGECNVTWPS